MNIRVSIYGYSCEKTCYLVNVKSVLKCERV